MKFLLAGDSDVGKDEILASLTPDGSQPNPNDDVAYKSTSVILDNSPIQLQLWDTSGQGRFSTIIRSYSRGAQGVLLVFDITRKWSFRGLDRWMKEIEEHLPGIPKILVGNRLHLAFNRQVRLKSAKSYAKKHNMAFYEVSHLCEYTIREVLLELCKLVQSRSRRKVHVPQLSELCSRVIISRTKSIDKLKLPTILKEHLRLSVVQFDFSVLRIRASQEIKLRDHGHIPVAASFARKIQNSAQAMWQCLESICTVY